MRNQLLLFAALLVLALTCESFARSYTTPPLVRRSSFTYPDPPAAPNKIGAVLHVYVVVRNISTIKQTVKVSLAPGTMAYTSSPDPNIHICLFTEGGNFYTSNPGNPNLILNSSQQVTKTGDAMILEPDTIGTFSFKAAYSLDFAAPPRWWHVLLYPIIKFTITSFPDGGERGAVTANVAIHSEGSMVTAGAPGPTGICNISGPTTAAPIPLPISESVNLADPQIQVNGGRAF